ncbi:HD domain-containing protein [bacterium]|nr:HD domain-containing protein [bacterium]
MSLPSVQKQINIPCGNFINNNIHPIKHYYKDALLSDDLFTHEKAAKKTINEIRPTKVGDLYNPKQLLSAYSNPKCIQKMIDANPKINDILQEKGIDTNICQTNISNILNSHITTTTSFALQIANQMNIKPQDKKLLEQACVFHDFGKVLIPSEILDKPGHLTEEEKSVVDLHSQLGYELLSTTGMNNRVLNLIKNHHNPMSENADVLGQILSVADIYSALREDRSYKNSMSEQEALNLLDQKAREGEVSTEVVNALKKALTSAKVA